MRTTGLCSVIPLLPWLSSIPQLPAYPNNADVLRIHQGPVSANYRDRRSNPVRRLFIHLLRTTSGTDLLILKDFSPSKL